MSSISLVCSINAYHISFIYIIHEIFWIKLPRLARTTLSYAFVPMSAAFWICQRAKSLSLTAGKNYWNNSSSNKTDKSHADYELLSKHTKLFILQSALGISNRIVEMPASVQVSALKRLCGGQSIYQPFMISQQLSFFSFSVQILRALKDS